MPQMSPIAFRHALTGYYGATALFLALDLGLGWNLRIAFLNDHDGWRLVYYGILFACLAAIVLRPGWTLLVSAVESLATMTALILGFGTRALGAHAVLDGGMSPVTPEEVLNFVISGSAAYLSWTRSLRALGGRPGGF